MKKTSDKVINLINQAIRELGQDFALSTVRNCLNQAIRICIDVDKKRNKREEQNKKLEEERKLKQENINKKIQEYWKQKEIEKVVKHGLTDNQQEDF